MATNQVFLQNSGDLQRTMSSPTLKQTTLSILPLLTLLHPTCNILAYILMNLSVTKFLPRTMIFFLLSKKNSPMVLINIALSTYIYIMHLTLTLCELIKIALWTSPCLSILFPSKDNRVFREAGICHSRIHIKQVERYQALIGSASARACC